MLVYLAVLLPVLLLFCGLAVDVGQMEIRRLQMQSASDAAAIGAALEAERGTGNYVAGGKGDASVNGFTDGSAGTTVGVQMVPAYGDYNGYYDAVQASISAPVGLTFLSLLGVSSGTVRAQSTALVAPCGYATGAAHLVSPVFTATSATMSSTCPWYFYRTVKLDTASTFTSMSANVVGPQASSTWSAAGNSPQRWNVPQASDPLAAIVQPTFSGCTYTNQTTPGGVFYVQSGTFCGNNVISGDTTIYFLPGLYIFVGNLTIQSGAVLNGTGVTFFFTSGGGYADGTVSVTGATLNLSAPTSTANGGIPGILVMNDRNWTKTNTQDFVYDSTTATGDGIYYLTGTGLQLRNSSKFTGTNYLGIDVDNLIVNNSTLSLKSNFSSVSGGSPFAPQGGLVQ